MFHHAGIVLAFGLTVAAGAATPVWAQGTTTERVSVGPMGAQGNGDSVNPAITPGGRFVAFSSAATNLVRGDTNGVADVFVRDRQAGRTTRVSVASDGSQADNLGGFSLLSISADGRFVAFDSSATNLVAGDTNGVADVFVHDRATGRTTRVSVGAGGKQGNGGSTPASLSAISADGRFVAFLSEATNLVPTDTNGAPDVFVRDRQAGRTTRVSVASDGSEANQGAGQTGLSISSDGRFVAFDSASTNLVPADDDNLVDIFVHDRQTAKTTLLSLGQGVSEPAFGSLGPAVSASGRFVAFTSDATNLAPGDVNAKSDIFVHDRAARTNQLVSRGLSGTLSNGHSGIASISPGGRFVGFYSEATNLVPADPDAAEDVFVRDRLNKRTELVSAGVGGAPSEGRAFASSVAAGGRFVAFESNGGNLVPGDTNGVSDIFVRAR